MNLDNLPRPARYFVRAVIGVIAFTVTFVVGMLLAQGVYLLIEEKQQFIITPETCIVASLVLAIAAVAILCATWAKAKTVAKRIAVWTLIGAGLFVGISGAVETAEGERLAAVADSFVPPAGLEREYEMNADEFMVSPAFVPCFDLMGEGCPHINRTWTADSLDRKDLEKSLSESGWSNVRIDENDCDLTDGDFKASSRCDAYGMVGEYKTDVSIMEITEGKWQMRIYLRSPENVR